jgi:glycerol-3-phosphate cytidylyltransferase
MFHIGHLRLLQNAKKNASELIVGISTDEFNTIKGKKTLIPYTQRLEIVKNIKCVDKVIPEKNWDQKILDIQTYNIDIFVMGDDWKGKFDYLKDYCEVKYLPRTNHISTTLLKNQLDKLLASDLKSYEDI